MRLLKFYAFSVLYYAVVLVENVRDAFRRSHAHAVATRAGLTHNHVKFFVVNTAFLSTFEAWKEYLVLVWPVVLVVSFVVFLRDEF